MKYLLLIPFSILLIQASCKDDPQPTPTDPAPIIERINPRNHQVYNFNDTAFFNLNFSDNKKLTDTKLKIYLATGETLIDLSFQPNANAFQIDTFIIMNDSAYSYVNFDISAKDEDANITSQSSHIHLRN